MKLGEIIREKRKALSLTQEQLADCLGVSAPAVHKWEKGITYPDITTLPALAEPWEPQKSPLYRSLDGGNVTSIAQQLRRRILDDLEHSEEFAFFRNSPEYAQLQHL